MPGTALCTWVVNKSGESMKEYGVKSNKENNLNILLKFSKLNHKYNLNAIIFQGRTHEKMIGNKGG